MSENNRPQGWGKEHTLPDNWGKQSSDLEIKTLSGGVSMSSSEPDRKSDIEAEDKVSFSDKASSGAGKLAGIAKKVGGAAKNAAGNAVEYAKSDEAKEKLNAAKRKMKSIADGAGSAFTDLKEKTGDTINEHRSSKVESALSANDISDNVIDDTFAFDTYKETSSDIVQPENSYDDRIDVSDLNPALGVGSDTPENDGLSADRQEIPDTSTEDAVDSAWGNSNSTFKKNEPVASPETNNKTSAQSELVIPNTNNKANTDSVHDAPVQDVKQPESISSPAPTLSSSPNQGYILQKQKTSPVLIIVIIVLVLVVGILGGMFFMVSKDKKSDTSGENSSVSDAVKTTAEITEASIGAETKTTTAAATTPVVSTTQTTNSIPDQYTSDEISAMFSAYIAENPDPNHTYDNSDYGYALIDLNSDSKQELLISSGENDEGIPMLQAAYAINNNKLKRLWVSDIRTYGTLCEDNYIHAMYIYGSGYRIDVYKYSSGDKFDLIESIDYDGSDYSTTGQFTIKYNDNSLISDDEAHSIIDKYKPIQFESKPLKINIQPTNSVTPVTKYGQINAPDGGPINGYTTEYIVGDGAYSCIRTDLMNNWHVTAVNSFYKNGTTWYELYDTDDGDYYGWLDEDHIKFY